MLGFATPAMVTLDQEDEPEVLLNIESNSPQRKEASGRQLSPAASLQKSKTKISKKENNAEKLKKN